MASYYIILIFLYHNYLNYLHFQVDTMYHLIHFPWKDSCDQNNVVYNQDDNNLFTISEQYTLVIGQRSSFSFIKTFINYYSLEVNALKFVYYKLRF